MTDASLAPESLPYVPSSATSQEAAVSMSTKAGRIRSQVFELIRHHPNGLTCDEIEARTGLRHQTASARVCELRDGNLIEATGEKRPTRSGRRAVVYRAASPIAA